MKLNDLSAIPESVVRAPTVEQTIEAIAQLALDADFNARLRGKRLTRYKITMDLWTVLKKHKAEWLYNRVVAHPAFQAAMI